MLTIRHQEQTGLEDVHEVKSVGVDPAMEKNGWEKTVWALEDGTRLEYKTGSIFVMNEFGKTVVIYHLKW